MSGIAARTGVPAARAGLEAAIRAALTDEPEVDIYPGFQWPVNYPDWTALGQATSETDPKNIGPRRQMDETITIDVNVGAWRPGRGREVAQAAYDRVFSLLVKIQNYILDGDNITLGGAVLWCVPGGFDADGEEFEGGFQAEIAARFVCSHRMRAN
ncbi:hypothetical protein [Microbacterium sp. UBA837]|uniref:hypothetical protein n=1 Tax=Microbacterium sp. UBA837 TaxID=1946956 RepID=UPI0025D7EDFF|nr:hypothetical protein [Microbacterium sp. UBA837]